jgi:hypothetical protein
MVQKRHTLLAAWAPQRGHPLALGLFGGKKQDYWTRTRLLKRPVASGRDSIRVS